MSTIDGVPQSPKGGRVGIEPMEGTRELALLLCVGVLHLRKELGAKSAPLGEVAQRLRRQPAQVEQGVDFAVRQGWLSRHDDHLALTATGIYLAKQALNLPR